MKLITALLYMTGVLWCMVQAEMHTAETYPSSPLKDGFRPCKMSSRSNVCDPDEILNESERNALDEELHLIKQRTVKTARSFCNKKGIDAVLAISYEANQALTNALLKKWKIDEKCHKAELFMLSSQDRRLFFAGDKFSGTTDTTFYAAVSNQQGMLSEGKFTHALTNIFKQIGLNTTLDTEVDMDTDDDDEHEKPVRKGASDICIPVFLILLASSLAMYI